MKATLLALVVGLAAVAALEEPLMNRVMPLIRRSHERCHKAGMCPYKGAKSIVGNPQKCEQGRVQDCGLSPEGQPMACPCHNVDMFSFLTIEDLGCTENTNDIWGWEHPQDGREIAIVGCYDGTSFVDVTVPAEPKVLGFLPTHGATAGSLWRDIKVYKDHAFIVAEASGHGLQVVDLVDVTRQSADRAVNRTRNGVPLIKEATHYGAFGNCHNIAINELSGFAYAIGATQSGSGYQLCRGGPHIVNIQDPKNPTFAACWGDDGYTHDSQCVDYHGPDPDHQGKQVCFNFNENSLTISDATDPTHMVMISRTVYAGVSYTHQGWVTEDHQFLLMDDELDEMYDANPLGKQTRTLAWDVRDLDNPKHTADCYSPMQSIDHNLYIHNKIAYLSNYIAGLRVYDASELDLLPSKPIEELGWFDVSPQIPDGSMDFQGTWSNYPYFKSETIVATGIERGLYVLKFNPTSEPLRRPLQCLAAKK